MFEKKRMAETSEIAQYAVESGVAQSSEDVIVLGDNVNRICAPSTQDDQKMWSIILWTKTTKDDYDPQPQKIVRLLLIIHNIWILLIRVLVWCCHLRTGEPLITFLSK